MRLEIHYHNNWHPIDNTDIEDCSTNNVVPHIVQRESSCTIYTPLHSSQLCVLSHLMLYIHWVESVGLDWESYQVPLLQMLRLRYL